jgi:hypothetical protein
MKPVAAFARLPRSRSLDDLALQGDRPPSGKILFFSILETFEDLGTSLDA